LINYYENYSVNKESDWKERLGEDLNWTLSFDKYKESETTKHVHRLHPYKGKFIPQLVEYFLDEKTDNFKQQVYFRPGDIILDPFSGSGTTMIQASELGMHAIGIDVSAFNAMIGNSKVSKYDLSDIQNETKRITDALKKFLVNTNTIEFETKLLEELYKFNSEYFPVPEYKYRLHNGDIDEKKFGAEKEKLFLPIYYELVKEYKIQLKQNKSLTFLDKWYSQHIREE